MHRLSWIGLALLAVLAAASAARAEGYVVFADSPENILAAVAAVNAASAGASEEASGGCDARCGGDAPCGCSCDPRCCCQPFAPLMIGADSPNVPRMGGLTFLHQSIVRVADNHSPLPQDRVGLSYHTYHNVPLSADLTPPRGGLHEFELLLEKQLLDGALSVELIVPFAATVSSTQQWTPAPLSVDRATEFGNLAVNLKGLLWRRANVALSGGVLVEAPTADDITLVMPNLTETLHTDAWYLTPYLATLITPTDRWYVQAFCSYRVPTRGNDLADNGVVFQTLRDQDLLMIDGGAGYWLYRNAGACWLTGFVPTVELHYTTTTTDGEGMSGMLNARSDYLNLTAGATALIRDRCTLAAGCVVPLRSTPHPVLGDTDRLFDWQLAAQFNWLW